MSRVNLIFRISSRRFVFFFLLALFSALPITAEQADSSAQAHFLAAQEFQQQGRFDDAVREYKAVLALQPDLPEVYVNLGLTYYAGARFAESAQALATAAKLRPGMRGVDLWLGIDEVKLDRPVEAIAHLRAAIHVDSADKLAQSWLGTALWNAGRRDAALRQLRTAAAQFVGDPDLLFASGEAYGKAVHQQTEELLQASRGTALSDRIYADLYAEERDWTKAEGHLRRAIERDPRSVEARMELGDIFFAQARFQDALSQMDQAAALDPRSAAVLARGGQLMILLQQPEEGLARIQKAMGIDRNEALDSLGLPLDDSTAAIAESTDAVAARCRQAAALLETNHSAAGHVALAAFYALAGDRDAASRAYRSLAAEPHPAPASVAPFAQAIDAFHAHRYDQAEDCLVRWLGAHPADHRAQYDLLQVRRKLSMQQIARLVAAAPDSYHVHQLLGQLYANRDEDEKAIGEYRAVAAARPDLPGIHFWLGHLYWKHGQADDALRELTRELELNPLHPEANGELGAVLVAQDRAADAIPHLESAIRSKPDLWPAYIQLGRAYASRKNYPRAEELLQIAVAHDPDGSAHYQLGMVLRAEGKSALAAQAFAEVRAIKNERMSAPSDADPSDTDQGGRQ